MSELATFGIENKVFESNSSLKASKGGLQCKNFELFK